MLTLRQFSNKPESIPASVSWYLTDLGEARGEQEAFRFTFDLTYTLLLEWTNSLTVAIEGNKAKDALPSNPAREKRADKESGHKTE